MSVALAGQRITAGGVLNRYYSLADANSHTVTAATQTALSSVYNIPANEAQVGTVYRITASGFGTWASSGPQTLNLGASLTGVQTGGNLTLAAALFPLSDAIRWEAEARVICVSTGSGGTWINALRGTINHFGTILATPNAFSWAVSNTGTLVASTLTVQTLSVDAAWGATTGAPTITCTSTVFEKLGS